MRLHVLIIILVFGVSIFGQSSSSSSSSTSSSSSSPSSSSTTSTQQAARGNDTNRLQQMANENIKNRQLDLRMATGNEGIGNVSEKYKLLLPKEMLDGIKARRVPNSEDTTKYKTFLAQPKTGLFRLFPDLGCDSKKVVRVDDACEKTVRGSSAFSFRQNDYRHIDFFDLRLKDGSLLSDGFLSQAIITDLGNVPLGDVTLAQSGMPFLVKFEPETQFPDVRRQYDEISKQIESDKFRYVNKIDKLAQTSTYAMRIIAYRLPENTISDLRTKNLNALERTSLNTVSDKRTDVIVAFRIVRQENDGSISILWKELSRQDAPKLKFPKNIGLADFKPEN